MAAVLSRRLIVLFLVAAVFLTGSAAVCYRAVRVLAGNQDWVNHSHEVLATIETVRATIEGAEADQRNFLVTNDASYLDEYKDEVRSAREGADLLAGLVGDNPEQARRAARLKDDVADRVQSLDAGIADYRANGYDAARKWTGEGVGRRAMERVAAGLVRMTAEEDRLLGVRQDESAGGLRRLVVTFSLVSLMSVGLLGVIFASVRREVGRRAEGLRQLKESEARLLLAVEAAELGIWEHDLAADRIFASARAHAVLGFPADAPVTSEQFLSRVHPEDVEHLKALVRKATEPGGRGEYVLEYRVVWPDGTVRVVRARGRAVFEGGGAMRRAVRIIGTVLDVTDARASEAELRRARDRAEEANRAKDQFLAVLSHELRTPLTPVLAAVSEFEQREDVPESLRADLSTVRRNIELEARLIDDLLDLTRVARGKIKLHPEVVDAHALVGGVTAMFRSQADEKGLHLGTELAAVRRYVWGDSGRLQQVLWNLLSNSIKFTPRGGRVSVTTGNDETGRLVIEVTDSGIGIDEAAIPRLFNAFEQGEQTISRKYGGLGLGLSIAKAIVDLHEGELEARSAGRDRGTTFVIRLKTVDAPKPAAAGTAAPAPGPSGNGPQKLRVLLVEDNEDTRRLMGRLLRMFGHHVEAADCVASALEIAGRERFDLLVSDIGLPDGTGWELMEKLGDRRPPKAIALSGFGMDEDLRKSREAGFVEHMTKPVNITELREIIARVTAVPSGAAPT